MSPVPPFFRRPPGRAALGALALVSVALSAAVGGVPAGGDLTAVYTTRIADPKLSGGGVEVAFLLSPPGVSERVVVEALNSQGVVVCTVTDAQMTGSVDPIEIFWDGRSDQGRFLDTGPYSVRVRLASGQTAELLEPVSLVRLGVCEVEAQASGAADFSVPDDEFQLVYFKKGGVLYKYYVTPATHEYISRTQPGEVSDLDLDNGDPRPAVAIHAATDEPVLSGGDFEKRSYNYPLCYVVGTRPRFEFTFGDTSTSAGGAQQGVGYPVAGIDLRLVIDGGGGAWTVESDAVAPGGTAVLVGPKLPAFLARRDWDLDHSFEYSDDGGTSWSEIPGTHTTAHRFYTTLATPRFTPNETGQQYAGPWVEVIDYITGWSEALGIGARDAAGVVEAGIRGFFGQQGAVPTSVEGIVYDAYPQGGDGGANHYFINSQHRIDLSALFASHANGVFVNCSDCAGSTSTMLSMMGVENVQLVHLGFMQLRAIWGIGTSGYTTNLWGNGHSFSYHKIITRDGGVQVSDACLWVDEDGNPNSTPGVPGFNDDREWDGQPSGYNYLSSYNNTGKSLQALPKIR
jgi:hypothetical protein